VTDTTLVPRTLVPEGDILFPESPRWVDDRLWLVDQHGHKVLTVDLEGNVDVVLEHPDMPSGMGVLPDGSIIVISRRRRVLDKIEADGSRSTYADLTDIPGHNLNDMVIDGRGNAYVGNRQAPGGPAANEQIILVELGGAHRVVADGITAPNGTVVTPDNKTLVIKDGEVLTAFTIEEDGNLTDRRVWAETPGRGADGICLDAEGGIWVASPFAHVFFRILEGGEVTDEIHLPEEYWAIAPVLGGPDGRTLFLLESRTNMDNAKQIMQHESPEGDAASAARGRVRAVEVPIPGAGWP
jgi:sugar lactone lactonase YvrE